MGGLAGTSGRPQPTRPPGAPRPLPLPPRLPLPLAGAPLAPPSRPPLLRGPPLHPPLFLPPHPLSRVSLPLSLSQTLERRPQDDNHIPGAPISSNFPSLLSRGGVAVPTQGGPWRRVRSLRSTKAARRGTGRRRTLCSVLAAVNRGVSGFLVPQEAGLPSGPSPTRPWLLPQAREPESELETRNEGPWERRRDALVRGARRPR